MTTEIVRLLRRSVEPLGQGDASADEGDLGPIGADSPCPRDAPVTHAAVSFDLHDDHGTPLGEFDDLPSAEGALRRLYAADHKSLYDVRELAFDADCRRVGIFTLDHSNPSGPILSHAGLAPAPPTLTDAAERIWTAAWIREMGGGR